jgi:conjugative relaxase-like TrwC/TraI family protein
MQMQEAQLRAVKGALRELEATAAFTRRGSGGKARERARLVVAAFEHGTSRAVAAHLPDPHLHTHALVMNACTREDGTTGTIMSKPFYLAKLKIGAAYRGRWRRSSRASGSPSRRTASASG